MRILFFLLLAISFIASSGRGAVWSLPAANQGHWLPGTDVGVPGGIAQYLAGGASDRAVTGTVINIRNAPYSADNTGSTDVTQAIVDAIAAASGPTVIYFPAGTYKISTGYINSLYKDFITFRGAGVGVTTFYCSVLNGYAFVMNSPGAMDSNMQTVTGAKTAGTSVLHIPSTTGYNIGSHITVYYENETDNTRIIAGAAPVWSSNGAPFARGFDAKVTAVSANTSITIDPPLPSDATNLVLKTGTYPADNKTSGWGFEDFSVSFDPAAHPFIFALFDTSEFCWAYNVKFTNWSRNASNGACFKISNSYKTEINHCWFNFQTGSSSDGAVQIGVDSSTVIVNNVFSGEMDTALYSNGNSFNDAILYNYKENNGTFCYTHGYHPSLNLFEGNVGPRIHWDGYHGSNSHQTIYRNFLTLQYPVVLDRFTRNPVLAGNIFGINGGTLNGASIEDVVLSFGNPNIGNGAADGFWGPTGASDQVGQIDYAQPGYGVGSGSVNTYVIQPSDVSVGDFSLDWNVTGTLTTRTSNTEGVFAMTGGKWFTGTSATGGAAPIITVRWSGLWETGGTVTNVSGSNITIQFTGGDNLPTAGTAVTVFFGAAGWQERDLDVRASATLAGNYMAAAVGSGSVANSIGANTFPDSEAYPSKPTFFGSLAWPPFNPNDYSTANIERIPAGYRFNHAGNDPGSSPSSGTTSFSGSGATSFSGSGSTTIQ